MQFADTPILRQMLSPFTQKASDETLHAFADFQASPAVEDRYHDLADRNAEGNITDEERFELENIVAASFIFGMLRDEARAALAQKAS